MSPARSRLTGFDHCRGYVIFDTAAGRPALDHLATFEVGCDAGLDKAGFPQPAFNALGQCRTGHVIGVDMTHEMLKKARDYAASIGARNVEFRLGELEHLPIADNTADVVISNCVINLVPDKAQVFREAFRVLKPGGRLAVSDVINIAPLPAELRADPALLCGCIAGAAPAERIEAWLSEAGFVEVRVTPNLESREMVESWASGRGIENHIASAMVEARKP